MNVFGVIMAGGGGTRFWPLSRKKRPKQLLNLSGNELMINETIDRLSYVTDKKNIFVVTNVDQTMQMKEVTKDRILSEHILSEPSARNTAACIGYAAIEILKKYNDGIMVITPSDHYIQDQASFTRVLNDAIRIAEQDSKLVTVGITPTFPSTGFGYIKFDKHMQEKAKEVIEFREKPDEENAKKYIESGEYVWNSGMFVWKASVILDKFKEYLPDIYEDLVKIGDAMNTDNEKTVIESVYPEIRKISIDYGIMEPSAEKGEVLVIPGEFGWNDVGSWDVLDVFHEADIDGNIQVGDSVLIDTYDSVIYSSGKLIATVGLNNIVIVETADAILVCDKKRSQDVKCIVEKLEKENRFEFS